MAAAHKWHPVTDLPDDPSDLTDGELDSLQRVWRNQKSQLIERASLDEFDKRLRREWSIETGIIEDVYTLDRGITRTLIEKGIDAALIPHTASNRDSIVVARIIQDHYDALEGMFDFVGGQRLVSTSYIKELHAALLRNVDTHIVVDQFGKTFETPLEKGLYKTVPNSPTRQDGLLHQYCPPEHVASEMDELIRMHREHDSPTIPPEVSAAWLHHRFTQIHPFSDGNGRVARAIASLVFIKAGWFPLIVRREDRVRYITALEMADQGELRPLVSMFVESQRNVLIQATEIAYDVRPITSKHEAVLAARDRLLNKEKLSPKEWLYPKDVATKLADYARNQFQEIESELTSELGSLGKGYTFNVHAGPLETENHFRERAISQAGHKPDFSAFNTLVELVLHTGIRAALTLSFHGIGPLFRGLIGVVPYLVFRGGDPAPIEPGIFQINYEEDFSSAQERFSKWLDLIIVEGLNMWRLTL